MSNQSSLDTFLEHVPALKIWYNVVLLSIFQLVVFFVLIFFFWWISTSVYYGAILVQSIVSILLVFFYIYLADGAEKIRDKYLRKYGKLAGQFYWFRYHSYTTPIIFMVFFFPLLLITYDAPCIRIISMPSHVLTNPLFPIFASLPMGVIFVIIGFLMKRFSGGYGADVDDYLYMIYPGKSKLITGGMYQYIRNPQYLSRGIIAVGFGFIANNISAILVGLIHFLSYCAIIPAEDKELQRRFGDDFKEYCEKVPAVFPRYGNWKKFLRFIFVGEK